MCATFHGHFNWQVREISETCDQSYRVDAQQKTLHLKGSHSIRQYIVQINKNSAFVWSCNPTTVVWFPAARSPTSKTITTHK